MRIAHELVAAILVLFLSSAAGAQWMDYGTPVCLADGEQGMPQLAPDGSGGAIITWGTFTFEGAFAYGDIFAQRVDGQGQVKWVENGVPICTASGEQYYPQIISDGSGGAIIAWLDERNGVDIALYAQRIAGDGSLLWPAGGVPVGTVVDGYDSYAMIGDGSGGAIIVWTDARGGAGDLYAQRLLANGSPAWVVNGLAVCVAAGIQMSPALIPDGSGGAIIAWSDDRRGDADLYVHRIDSNGSGVWGVGGVPVCSADSMQGSPNIVSDGGGGAIVAWIDKRSGKWDNFVQKVDANGSCVWTLQGVRVCSTAGDKYGGIIIPDGSGGVFVSWDEYRSCGDIGCSDLFAQRIDANGSIMWASDGVTICAAPEDQVWQQIVPDGSGGAIISWWDFRRDNGDIYAQRVASDGVTRWTDTGVPVSSAFGLQYYLAAISDGQGGAIITWQDMKYHNHIFAQRIERNGYWGYPSPQIVSIGDVPEDDGGFVRLTWEPSRLDAYPDHIVSCYTVWRETAGVGAAREAGSSWEQVGARNADYSSQYVLTAPTLADSSFAGLGLTRFRVVAETANPEVYWTSTVDSCYSIDNLPPVPAEGFAGAQSITPPGLNLSWQESESPDLSYYSLHKAEQESFVPDASNLVGTTASTIFFDPGWSPVNNTYCYKLIAVDIHGNCSIACLLRPEDITVGTLLQSFAAAHSNAGIDVSWRLSEAGLGAQFVVLRAEGSSGTLIEMAGARINSERSFFAFRDETIEPGGTYRYRVDVSDEDGRRVLFETEAISAPEMPFALYQNHPNPFNPSTVIRYYLPVDARVVLEIFDAAGRSVALLVNESQEKGRHAVLWTGTNGKGDAAGSGLYFCTLRAGKEALSRKMILLR